MISTFTHEVDKQGICKICGILVPPPQQKDTKKVRQIIDGDKIGVIVGDHCGTHSYFCGEHNTAPNCSK